MTGLPEASPFNTIDCLTGLTGAIEAKGRFRGLSNRDGPPPEMETAAPMGIGNGGKSGKQPSNSKTKYYSTEALAAIAKTHPIIALHFFGFEELGVAA